VVYVAAVLVLDDGLVGGLLLRAAALVHDLAGVTARPGRPVGCERVRGKREQSYE
jgi:hypothetical protein